MNPPSQIIKVIREEAKETRDTIRLAAGGILLFQLICTIIIAIITTVNTIQ